MKKLIVITTPYFFPDEAFLLVCLLRRGLERLHIRKPEGDKMQVIKLLKAIPSEFYSRIVLHDYFELTETFGLGGIHLNRRNPDIPEGYRGCVSASCHSLQEIRERKSLDYVFLSPIFPSLSKEGYGSGFSKELLQEASEKGIIDSKVIALGGLDCSTLPLLKSFPFGGYAVLGALWGKCPDKQQTNLILEQFKQLQLCR